MRAVAFSALALCGCGFAGQWAPPKPLFRAGAPLFYAVSQKQIHGTQHSWKAGGSLPTREVSATRFRAIDIRTCSVARTTTVPGSVNLLAWDADGDDLWFTTEPAFDMGSERAIARSLSGASLTLPVGGFASFGDTALPPLRAFDDAAHGLFHIWDVHARTISSIPRRPGSAALLLADERRAVALLPADSAESTTLLLIPRTPTLDVAQASQTRVTAPGLSQRNGWLSAGSFVTQAGSAFLMFDLHSGALFREQPVPKLPWQITEGEHPTLIELRAPRETSTGRCFGSFESTDLLSGAHHEAWLPDCVQGFGAMSNDPNTIVFSGLIAGKSANFATKLGPGSPFVLIAGSLAPRVEVLGSSLFYADAALGPHPLMVADLTNGSLRPVTAPLDAIESFQADSASGSVIIETARRILAYRVATARLDACDGE